ncbi:hypothetical protein LG58_2826 [Kosakonia radicincitans YD4]|nr:hypothetical protein LG58_2826 [Kosakonia radicincitans YD4]
MTLIVLIQDIGNLACTCVPLQAAAIEFAVHRGG